jgi:hypothetical protein
MLMRLLTLTKAGSFAVFLAFQAEPSVPVPPNVTSGAVVD